MPPSFVCIIKTENSSERMESLTNLNNILCNMEKKAFQEELVKDLSAADINLLMFSSEPEEKETNSESLYYIPKF